MSKRKQIIRVAKLFGILWKDHPYVGQISRETTSNKWAPQKTFAYINKLEKRSLALMCVEKYGRGPKCLADL